MEKLTPTTLHPTHWDETTRESIYRHALEQVVTRVTSTCTADPLGLLDIVTTALKEATHHARD